MIGMRWILHSDINSCYSSIELVFRPNLRDKPVVVGGDEEARHGIVLAKNLIAKKFGIKTGVALVEARRYCPDLISLPPNYPLYLKYARIIREIYSEYSNAIEPFGLDEAWVDISYIASNERDAVMVADEIRTRIFKELGVTVSIGVSWNKPYAKLGSDYRKPDAITLISKENYQKIVYPLPASDLLYVGSATEKKLAGHGINTIGSIAEAERSGLLKRLLGKVGDMLWVFASGSDNTPVIPMGEEAVIKSVGNSSTFPRDLVNDEDVKMAFYVLGESVSSRLRENGFECRTVQISLRGNDLFSFERQMKLERPTNLADELVPAAMRLFTKNYTWQRPLRSIGIRGTDLIPAGSTQQLSLFVDEQKRDKVIRLENATDYIRDRFGYFSLQRAILLQDRSLTGLDAKKENIIHPVGYTYVG